MRLRPRDAPPGAGAAGKGRCQRMRLQAPDEKEMLVWGSFAEKCHNELSFLSLTHSEASSD